MPPVQDRAHAVAMPRTLSLPVPSMWACTICATDLTGPRCPACGADFGRPEGQHLWRVDHQLHHLSRTRDQLVEQLLAAATPSVDPELVTATRAVSEPTAGPEPATATAAHPSSTVPSRTQDLTVWSGDDVVVPHGPTGPGRHDLPPVDPAGPGPSVAEMLVGLGALSLVAAVVVFAAVAWDDLAAWIQGGLLVTLTGLVGGVAVACRRRELVATSEALGGVAVALAVADVQVTRVALDGVAAPRPVWAAGLAAVAVGAALVGRSTRLRSLTVAAVSLAFLPAAVLAAGAGSPSALVWVLGAQALVALACAPRLRGWALERGVVEAGGWICWTGATLGALVVSGIGLSAYPSVDPFGPAALLAALAAGSIAVGQWTGTRALTLAATGLAFVPAVLALAGRGEPTPVLWVLVGQSVVAVLAGSALSRWDVERIVVLVGGVVSWSAAGLGALLLGVGGLVGEPAAGPAGAAAVLVALAAVALGSGVVVRWPRDVAGASLAAGTSALIGAAGLVAGGATGEVIATVVAVTAGVLVVAAAVMARIDPARPWVAVMTTAASVVGIIAIRPVMAVVATINAYLDVSTPPADGGVGQPLGDRLGTVDSLPAELWPVATTLVQLLAVMLVAVGGLVLGKRWATALLAGVGVAAALTAPVALDLTVGVTAALLAPLVVAGALWLVLRPRDPVLLVTELALAAVGVAVVLGSPPLTVAATTLISMLGATLALAAVRAGRRDAEAWVGATLAVTLTSVAFDSGVLGATGSGPALALAVAAAVAAVVAPLIERFGPDGDGQPALIADVVVTLGLGLALIISASIDGASVVVAIAGVVAGTSALRPSRRGAWLAALTAVVVLVWMRLGAAEVTLVEAYTQPLAAALLVAGLLGGRHRSSWERVGAGLVAAVVPTAVIAIGDGDLVRTVAVVAAAALLALWGASIREQAPLAIGSATLTAVALRHLAPVAAELPRYLVFAVAGIVLVAAGATFEQRRRDVRRLRDAFADLA